MTIWREQSVGRLITTQVRSRQIWNRIVKVTFLLMPYSSVDQYVVKYQVTRVKEVINLWIYVYCLDVSAKF